MDALIDIENNYLKALDDNWTVPVLEFLLWTFQKHLIMSNTLYLEENLSL